MSKINIDKLDFKKSNGLIPVITQDYTTKKVLILAYMNKEALGKTIETGYVHYWSRSKEELWKKGGTSGCVQKVREILVDCDEDALLIIVDQTGPACHTGAETCFFRKLNE